MLRGRKEGSKQAVPLGSGALSGSLQDKTLTAREPSTLPQAPQSRQPGDSSWKGGQGSPQLEKEEVGASWRLSSQAHSPAQSQPFLMQPMPRGSLQLLLTERTVGNQTPPADEELKSQRDIWEVCREKTCPSCVPPSAQSADQSVHPLVSCLPGQGFAQPSQGTCVLVPAQLYGKAGFQSTTTRGAGQLLAWPWAQGWRGPHLPVSTLAPAEVSPHPVLPPLLTGLLQVPQAF